MFSVVILFTQLKYYIPGNSSNISRKNLFKSKKLFDPLIKVNNCRERFIYNLLLVANGQLKMQNDTSSLTPKQIEQAIIDNSNQIERGQ